MDRFVRYAALTGYPELARSVGLDPARLMADEGLDVADLVEQDRWIPAVPVARLLERSAAESGCWTPCPPRSRRPRPNRSAR